MSSINTLLFIFIFFGVAALIYLAIIVMLLRRSIGQKLATYLTTLYALLALLMQAGQTAWLTGFLPNLNAFTLEQIQWFGTLALSLVLLLILYSFLGKKKSIIWLGVGIFWTIALLLLAYDVFQLPDILWTNGTWLISRERVNYGVIALGWMSFVFGAFFTYKNAYKNM